MALEDQTRREQEAGQARVLFFEELERNRVPALPDPRQGYMTPVPRSTEYVHERSAAKLGEKLIR